MGTQCIFGCEYLICIQYSEVGPYEKLYTHGFHSYYRPMTVISSGVGDDDDYDEIAYFTMR